MKKTIKISLLHHFLIVLVLSLPLFLTLDLKKAFSSNYKINQENIPLKRPLNLFQLEESTDTILNLIQKVGAKPTVGVKKTNLKQNETLNSALLRINFNSENINKIINSIYNLKNGKKILSSLPVGMNIDYSNPSDLTGAALKLNYSKKRDIFVWQDFDNNYISQVFLRPTKLENTLVKGIIKSNLYISALKSGMPENTLLEMISLLGFSVDFQREIREGDAFEVLFSTEIDVLKNIAIQTKPIIYVSLTLSGNRLDFFRYNDKYGLPQYYDQNGKSSKRTIMKTPINGARISSRYGNRKHPILGYTKMHRGLDFAAPIGTPVFAAGDGVIEKAGWNGSYGRYIRIRHTSTYKTAYAHLSGIKKNIRVGKRVLQGKTIGYVGSSGRSTGPHLHYEVLKNNKQINPMKIKLPAGKNIPEKSIAVYKSYVKKIINQKIALEKSIKNKKVAANLFNNLKIQNTNY
ncbi:peptidoglycan DD-metalloendopeptidase family protein [Alphaproteobacteria bacterium]|nr:peptidoglycan DD-metalloendopeptidase family protein [Alphaproteobacteria bacterium]